LKVVWLSPSTGRGDVDAVWLPVDLVTRMSLRNFLDFRSLMTKKKTAKKTKPKAAKPNPCWDGYEPTPGKKAGTKGSCRLKKK